MTALIVELAVAVVGGIMLGLLVASLGGSAAVSDELWDQLIAEAQEGGGGWVEEWEQRWLAAGDEPLVFDLGGQNEIDEAA